MTSPCGLTLKAPPICNQQFESTLKGPEMVLFCRSVNLPAPKLEAIHQQLFLRTDVSVY